MSELASPNDDDVMAVRLLVAEAFSLPIADVQPSSRLSDFSPDSLDLVGLQFRLEEAFCVRLRLKDLSHDLTVQELIERARASERIPPPAEPTPTPARKSRRLTYGERTLWMDHMRDPHSSKYHIGGTVKFFDQPRAALEVAARRVLQNAIVLSARFRDERSATFDSTRPLDLRTVDASPWPEEMLLARIEREWNEPFDLVRGGPYRFRLYCRGRTTIAMLAVHHIVCDQRSLEILVGEFLRAIRGLPVPVREDVGERYRAWFDQYRRSERSREARSYWKGALAGADPAVKWPKLPSPPTSGGTGKAIHVRLVAERLLAACRGAKVTPFSFCLAAFSWSLCRLTGQAEAVVATSVAVRPGAEFEAAIGYYANTVILRAAPDEAATPAGYVSAVHETVMSGLDHAAHPVLDRGIRPCVYFQWAEANRAVADVKAAVLQLGGERLAWPVGTVEILAVPRHRCHSDLIVTVARLDSELVATFEYDPDAVDPACVRWLADRFPVALEELLRDPHCPLGERDLLTEREIARLDGINGTTVTYSEPHILHELVREAAAQNAARVATIGDGRTLTFAELDALADGIATHLQIRGVRSGDRVVLCLEPGCELPPLLLGVLRAGASFVPVAVDAAPKWIEAVLRDIEPVAIVTRGTPCLDGPVVPLAELMSPIASAGFPPVAPDDAAAVLYTSGTTGQPKGVVLTHRGLCNRLIWMRDQYPLEPDDRILQKTPYTFDVSLWEFFLPMISGVAQIVARPGEHREPAALARRIVEDRATMMHVVPSMLAAMLIEPDFSLAGCLRRIISSGETLSRPCAERLFHLLPRAELHNLYGPTEASIDVTFHHVKPDDPRDPIPIGRPIANTRVYVLDTRGRPAPPGIVGELHLAGVGLARGYWNRPGLTDRAFFAWKHGGREERLYRTGDLACFEPDGSLQFHGRVDRQVKIGGHRIELEAIEAVLARHPLVRDCAVIVDAKPSMIAFVVVDRTSPPSESDLAAWVERSLPASHRPNQWRLVPEIPRNSSGKRDAKALAERSEPADSAAAWADPSERQLAHFISAVLERVVPGRDADFFALGGDSLRALQLSATLGRAGFHLPVSAIYAAPTVGELAKLVRPKSAARAGSAKPFSLLDKSQSKALLQQYDDAFPLTRLQEVLLYHGRRRSAANAVLGATFTGKWSRATFEASLAAAMQRHPMLRTAFELGGLEPVQVVHRFVHPPLEVHAWDGKDDSLRVALAVERERQFDWSTAPLFRIRVEAGEGRFHIALAHPAFDGWSVMTLIGELLKDYAARLADRPPPRLPIPVTTMADFVRWERSSIASEADREYWTRIVGELPPAAQPAIEHGSERSRFVQRIERRVSALLRACAEAAGCPLKTVLLSVHLAIEGLRSDAARPATGMIVHGREETSDGDRVVGLFLNTVPFSVETRGRTWRELFRAALECERGLWPHRRFPLVEIRRLAGRLPFTAAFNYVHFHNIRGLSELANPKLVSWSNPSDFSFLPFVAYFVDDPFTRELSIIFDHDRRAVPVELVEEIAALHVRTLEGLVERIDEPVEHDLSLPPRNRLAGPAGPRIEEPIHRRIARIAKERPHDLAADDWTFARLMREANAIAARLHEQRVRPEEPVVVTMEHGPPLLAAMLGILQSGACILPIGADWPPDLRSEAIRECVVRFGCFDRDPGRDAPLDILATPIPLESFEAEVPLDSLAYVMFTSGSTGKPKGVEVSHRSLAAAIVSIGEHIGLTADDRGLALTQLTFDIALLELLMPAAFGASVLPVPGRDVRDGTRLAAVLTEAPWTVAQATPSIWRLALAGGWDGFANRKILCGGETMDARLTRLLCERASEVWNCYGPTEATIWATIGRVQPSEAEPPIGRPLPGTIIDIEGASYPNLPHGSPGEILIAGNLARGYCNDLEATARRFITRPDGKLWYRTGDCGRWTERGELEFLGRQDLQIKLRGVRIELEEIEAVLRSEGSVCSAVAILEGRGDEDKRIVALVQSASVEPALVERLHRKLASRLPPAFMPAAIHRVDSFPLTPSGKVDRAALAAAAVAPRHAVHHEPPLDEFESRIAAVWAESLGLPSIGRHENYFMLGGHSLLALRACMKLEAELGLTIAPTRMFETPTLASFVASLKSHGGPDAAVAEAARRGRLRAERSAARKS